jgi:hypothetical protein
MRAYEVFLRYTLVKRRVQSACPVLGMVFGSLAPAVTDDPTTPGFYRRPGRIPDESW